MVDLSDLVWLQGAFNALVDLFDRVGLQNNFGKTVGMVYHPCQAEGKLTTAAYGRIIRGRGKSYMERLRYQVACGECVEMLAVSSLSSHLMNQHRRAAGQRRQWNTLSAGRMPQVYRM